MGSLVDYAKHEISLLEGAETDDAQVWMNKQILDLITVFSEQGHSGFSAHYLIASLDRLMRFKPLKPLTGEDDEWLEICEEDGVTLYQNKRCSSVFKKGDVAYDIDAEVFSTDGGVTWFFRGGHRTPVTFPYSPPTKPEQILLTEVEGE
jgi:hypothetical protein